MRVEPGANRVVVGPRDALAVTGSRRTTSCGTPAPGARQRGGSLPDGRTRCDRPFEGRRSSWSSTEPLDGVAPGQASYATEEMSSSAEGVIVRELIDCHIHTERCGHGTGTVADESARPSVRAGRNRDHRALPCPTSSTRTAASRCPASSRVPRREVDLAGRDPRGCSRAGARPTACPVRETETTFAIVADASDPTATGCSRQRPLPRRVGVRRP